ncbi:hypothetical protein ACUOFC_32990, partial [Escherichia sp. TWPC-MK]
GGTDLASCFRAIMERLQSREWFDADTLKHQLALTGDEDRLELEWHQALLRGEMPQTIGGGIGQSRLTMLLLQLPHIGQVQCGVWPAAVRENVPSLL